MMVDKIAQLLVLMFSGVNLLRFYLSFGCGWLMAKQSVPGNVFRQGMVSCH